MQSSATPLASQRGGGGGAQNSPFAPAGGHMPALSQVERQFENFLLSMRNHLSNALGGHAPATPTMIAATASQYGTTDLAAVEAAGPEAEWLPHLDIFEDDSQVLVLVDLPGVPTNTLHVEMRDAENILIIEGSRGDSDLGELQLGENKRCWIHERSTGFFKRIIVLPIGVDSAREPDAFTKNGMLIVRLLKIVSRRGSGKKLEIRHL
ncbi:hypothetical protein SeLEV6574_g07170 [Synchytrium endobioticum]|uniref:SHSP domain-containing protein n=1 Tax=Synchytrium endobioticum TaxID=286115 RepID=A0A507CJ48_9FUNG|nr:hypothetical protein SeLEV6574_g07170 [Synchytrium endobioticum]